MTSVSRLLQDNMAKIHENPSNIHKVMTPCANRHSYGLKGYYSFEQNYAEVPKKKKLKRANEKGYFCTIISKKLPTQKN